MTNVTIPLAPSNQFLAAVRQLFTTWFSAREGAPVRPLTAFDEADQMRAMADDLLKSDPALAQDLYTAADRHEIKG